MTEVVIEFKPTLYEKAKNDGKALKTNLLIIKIQPRKGYCLNLIRKNREQSVRLSL